jgi:hypothetical protein
LRNSGDSDKTGGTGEAGPTDRADRGRAAVRVGGENTHTGGHTGRRETPKTRKTQAGVHIIDFRRLCLFVCLFV